jgi:MraZ protein
VFQGASQINLDAKGRMAVPTRLRDPLTQGGTVGVVLTAHPDGCLLLYPLPAWEPVRAQVMAFPSTNQQASLWKRLLIGFAEELALDGAGRLLISPELRTYARIDKRGDVRRPGFALRDLGPGGLERAARALAIRGQSDLAPGHGELLAVKRSATPGLPPLPEESEAEAPGVPDPSPT